MSKISKRNISRKYQLKRKSMCRKKYTKKQYRVCRTKRGGTGLGARLFNTVESVMVSGIKAGSKAVGSVVVSGAKAVGTAAFSGAKAVASGVTDLAVSGAKAVAKEGVKAGAKLITTGFKGLKKKIFNMSAKQIEFKLGKSKYSKSFTGENLFDGFQPDCDITINNGTISWAGTDRIQQAMRVFSTDKNVTKNRIVSIPIKDENFKVEQLPTVMTYKPNALSSNVKYYGLKIEYIDTESKKQIRYFWSVDESHIKKVYDQIINEQQHRPTIKVDSSGIETESSGNSIIQSIGSVLINNIKKISTKFREQPELLVLAQDSVNAANVTTDFQKYKLTHVPVDIVEPNIELPLRLLLDIAHNVYPSNSEKKTINGYIEIEIAGAGTNSLQLYQSITDNQIFLLGVRGTEINLTDIAADISLKNGILGDNLKQSKRYKDDKLFIESKIKPLISSINDAIIIGIGHSLGGAINDELLDAKLIDFAISFNPAVQQQHISNINSNHKRFYLESDPLYKILVNGSKSINPLFIENCNILPHKTTTFSRLLNDKLPKLSKLLDYVNQHKIDSFHIDKEYSNMLDNLVLETSQQPIGVTAAVPPISSKKPSLPANWEALIDDETNDVYYYNRITGETQWNYPQEVNEVENTKSVVVSAPTIERSEMDTATDIINQMITSMNIQMNDSVKSTINIGQFIKLFSVGDLVQSNRCKVPSNWYFIHEIKTSGESSGIKSKADSNVFIRHPTDPTSSSITMFALDKSWYKPKATSIYPSLLQISTDASPFPNTYKVIKYISDDSFRIIVCVQFAENIYCCDIVVNNNMDDLLKKLNFDTDDLYLLLKTAGYADSALNMYKALNKSFTRIHPDPEYKPQFVIDIDAENVRIDADKAQRAAEYDAEKKQLEVQAADKKIIADKAKAYYKLAIQTGNFIWYDNKWAYICYAKNDYVPSEHGKNYESPEKPAEHMRHLILIVESSIIPLQVGSNDLTSFNLSEPPVIGKNFYKSLLFKEGKYQLYEYNKEQRDIAQNDCAGMSIQNIDKAIMMLVADLNPIETKYEFKQESLLEKKFDLILKYTPHSSEKYQMIVSLKNAAKLYDSQIFPNKPPFNCE